MLAIPRLKLRLRGAVEKLQEEKAFVDNWPPERNYLVSLAKYRLINYTTLVNSLGKKNGVSKKELCAILFICRCYLSIRNNVRRQKYSKLIDLDITSNGIWCLLIFWPIARDSRTFMKKETKSPVTCIISLRNLVRLMMWETFFYPKTFYPFRLILLLCQL